MVRMRKQSRESRRHESEGMKRYEEKYHNDERRSHEGRRREMKGSHDRYGSHDMENYKDMDEYEEVHKRGLDSRFMEMVSEDHHAPSNLPMHVIHKEYPKSKYSDKYELDDTIYGIDENSDSSVRKVDDYPSTSMY